MNGQIRLGQITSNDGPTVGPQTGQKHLHLKRRGILGFVKDDERTVQRAPAHIGQRYDFHNVPIHVPFELVKWKHILQGVV